MGTKIKCKHCGEVIESRHKHDFVSCKCKSCAINGGDDYFSAYFPYGSPDFWYEIIRENEDAVTD